tara:strand:+ start:1408 stop:1719 length:312 start_codon:yes stop_codon:yes gene_type:complete
MSTEESKMPSVWQMVKSFTKDVTRYISEGAPNVSLEDYTERVSACENCEHFKKEKARCGLCGCLVQYKAQWKTSNCPDLPPRWKPQVISHGKNEEGDNTDSSN